MTPIIKTLRWSSPDWEHLAAIRRQVFIEEQGVSETEERDGLDDAAQHFLVTFSGERPISDEHPIGCARVLCQSAGAAQSYQVGRVALLASFRGRGIGTRLMYHVIRWCLQDAFPSPTVVTLAAQFERMRFYERLGFIPRGQPFLDAGMSHQTMTLHPDLQWRYI